MAHKLAVLMAVVLSIGWSGPAVADHVVELQGKGYVYLRP